MKDFLKTIGLMIVGLLTAIVLYPFLHEAGHSLVAMLLGARIMEFNVLPIPYMVCEVSAVDIAGQILIGAGGIFFPYVLSMLVKPKWFWLWYANLIVRGISVYSIFLSIIAIVLHINGKSWQNEDIVQILRLFPNGTGFFLVVLCIVGTYGFVQLSREKVFLKCIDYFCKTEKIG